MATNDPLLAELDRLNRRRQGASMMMLSPTAQISGLGKADYDSADSGTADIRKRQTKATEWRSLGNGILYNPATGESRVDPNFQTQEEGKYQRELERDRLRDAAALERAQVMANIKAEAKDNVSLGNIPSGYERVKGDDGSVTDRPLIGSKTYLDAVDKTKTLYQGMANVNRMIDMIEMNGSMVSPLSNDQKGTAANLYGDIMAAVAQAQNKGVLQAGEAEMIMSQLPDPTAIKSLAVPNDQMIKAYQQLLNQLKMKLQGQQATFDTWNYDLPANEYKYPVGDVIEDNGKFYQKYSDGSFEEI